MRTSATMKVCVFKSTLNRIRRGLKKRYPGIPLRVLDISFLDLKHFKEGNFQNVEGSGVLDEGQLYFVIRMYRKLSLRIPVNNVSGWMEDKRSKEWHDNVLKEAGVMIEQAKTQCDCDENRINKYKPVVSHGKALCPLRDTRTPEPVGRPCKQALKPGACWGLSRTAR